MQKLIKYKEVILVTIILLGFCFYWFQFRPSIIKSNCYTEAKEKAIEKTKTDESATYLFDRNHWKNGPEPAYIQEHLDIIAKETDFYVDDYNIYYKLCLQSKGL